LLSLDELPIGGKNPGKGSRKPRRKEEHDRATGIEFLQEERLEIEGNGLEELPPIAELLDPSNATREILWIENRLEVMKVLTHEVMRSVGEESCETFTKATGTRGLEISLNEVADVLEASHLLNPKLVGIEETREVLLSLCSCPEGIHRTEPPEGLRRRILKESGIIDENGVTLCWSLSLCKELEEVTVVEENDPPHALELLPIPRGDSRATQFSLPDIALFCMERKLLLIRCPEEENLERKGEFISRETLLLLENLPSIVVEERRGRKENCHLIG
jgi:hypothetical protein